MCQATSQSSLSYAINLEVWTDVVIRNSKGQQFENLIFHSIGTIFHLKPVSNAYESGHFSLYCFAISYI